MEKRIDCCMDLRNYLKDILLARPRFQLLVQVRYFYKSELGQEFNYFARLCT